MTIKCYSSAEYEQLVHDFAHLKLLSDKNYRDIRLLIDGIDSDYIVNNISPEDEKRVDEERLKLDHLVELKYLELKNEQAKKDEEAKQKAIALQKMKEQEAKKKLREAELQQLAILQAKYQR